MIAEIEARTSGNKVSWSEGGSGESATTTGRQVFTLYTLMDVIRMISSAA